MKSVALSLCLSLLFIAASVVSAASTISTNIATDGNLTVTGTTGLTGLTTMVFASSTGQSISQNLIVGGYATTTGATGNIATQGTLTVTSTSGFTGLATFVYASSTGQSVSQNLLVGGNATTTGLTGNFASAGTITASSTIGVGTTTPSAEISALGNATTTLYMHTSLPTAGTCIELKAASSSVAYRMYIGSYGAVGGYAGTSSSTPLIVEPGSCK